MSGPLRPGSLDRGEAAKVIELSAVGKVFPGVTDVPVLKSVDLALRAGELVAITGPSGSGKSTLMDIMGTLGRPTTGSVTINGCKTEDLASRELAALRSSSIGFVFQQFNLLPALSALANVELSLVYRRIGAKERRRRARGALEQVGLGHRLDHRPGELSGGERQRVAIARALVSEPSMILADEPTGSLDQGTSRDIIKLLRYANAKGALVVVVTHDRHLADSIPRRISILDGRIVSDERPDPQPRSDLAAV